jgi:hypothetical protein
VAVVVAEAVMVAIFTNHLKKIKFTNYLNKNNKK